MFSLSQISAPPPLVLHRRIFRFSLTPTFSRNKLMARFRPFEARFPLRSPSAVSLKDQAPHRALEGQYLLSSFFSTRAGPNLLCDVQDSTPKTPAVPGQASQAPATREEEFLISQKENHHVRT